MIQTPVIVTFANQKGGVGKTTLCVTFANYLVTKGVRVVVIDCDFQHSIMKCRKADIRKYGEQDMPYEVWAYEANDKAMMTSLMEKLHNDPEIDVVLMDTPSSLKAEGLVPMFVNSDIIMMDGGRGQVNICLQVLEELGLDIPVCGMVKDDNHRTRGLYFHNVEIPIDRHGEGFKLITRIQDEAHRFAIEYHRSLRSKAQVHSILDDIEGIGPARRKALMRRFQSMENMKNASVEELAETDSMNLAAAQNVYDTLHSGPA